MFAIIQFNDIFLCLISSDIDISSCEVPYNLRTGVLVVFNLQINSLYRENFYFVDRFHISALHSDRGAACCKVHTNFADASVCLTASNILADPYFT
jgi:hypothetical protein